MSDEKPNQKIPTLNDVEQALVEDLTQLKTFLKIDKEKTLYLHRNKHAM